MDIKEGYSFLIDYYFLADWFSGLDSFRIFPTINECIDQKCVLVYKNIVIILRQNTGMENYHLMCGTQFCKLSSLLSHHFQLYAKKIAWNRFHSGRFNLFWEEVLLSSDATLWQYPNPPGNLPVWAARPLGRGSRLAILLADVNAQYFTSHL